MSQSPEELAQKIKDARDRQNAADGVKTPEDKVKASQARTALRAATDLVAALITGGFLGYWIDRWLGIKPWGMVLFIILGFAAGFLNIYRSQTGQDYKVGFKEDSKKE